MVEAPFVIADIAITIVKAIADICVIVIAASIGGWRYLLSSTYRKQLGRNLENRNAWYRASVYVGGAFLVIVSVPAIAAVGWVVWRLVS